MNKNEKYYQIRVTKGHSCEGVMDGLTSYDVFRTKEDAIEFAELYKYGSGVEDYEIDEYGGDDIEEPRYINLPTKDDTLVEYCPHCEQEVDLHFSFAIQRCPNCGKLIAPCNLCNHNLCDCANCPLAKLTAKLKY